MEYVIGFIILLLALFVTGITIKKKHYKEMDRLEAWKIDMTNRPVLDEMSKVKQLNMTGQTEELFERWRDEWDEVVTVKLPDLEELLFDAEDYIDKYRFNKSKEVQQLIETKLTEIENQIQSILDELNELVGSEEKNRLEIEILKEQYREAKKILLAHRHSFGSAEKELEHQLDDIIQKIQEFDEKTHSGDYLEAREIVLKIKNSLETIEYKMERIPDLLLEVQTILPNQIAEVREGYYEMAQQGYFLEHLHFEKGLAGLETELADYVSKMNRTDIKEVEKGVAEMKGSIDVLYDLLEKEVLAKQFIHQYENPTKELLQIVHDENVNLKEELLQVQQSYHLTESELEVHASLEKQLLLLDKKQALLEGKLDSNDSAHSLLSEELKEVKDELELIREGQRNFAEKLMALRKDEMAAREKIKDLSRNVAETIRLVSKSNIPGLPSDYKYLIDDSRESIQNVMKKLEEKPLDIYAVQQYLEISVMTIEKLTSTTNELVENVVLAEKVIQYGNRYRSKYPSVAKGLLEAEKSFRSFDYRGALEQAATSIEEVDPDAIKKIEALLSEN